MPLLIPDIKMIPTLIREASIENTSFILACVKGLASHIGQLDNILVTEEKLQEELFGENSHSTVLIAYTGEEPIGFILYFKTFSTFKGCTGLYIGDLYVVPKFRKCGVGKKLFLRVIDIAKEKNYCRIEWYVTNSNEEAKSFYHTLGANVLAEKSIYSIDLSPASS